MRIALDHRQLLGFGNGRQTSIIPQYAAKVGTKDLIVLTADHADFAEPAPVKTALVFPA